MSGILMKPNVKDKLWDLLSLLFVFVASILLTIYLAWLSYPVAIAVFKLEEVVNLSKDKIATNFNQLMAFLTFPWVSQLHMADFGTSASGLKHFFDVKMLFHLVQALTLLTLGPAWFWLRKKLSEKTLWHYTRTFFVLFLLPAIIGLLGVMIGFDHFFTLFHQILFPGDSSWLFDPRTDPVIWILPAQFFLACFLLFFSLYELSLITLLIKAYRQVTFLRKAEPKRDKLS